MPTVEQYDITTSDDAQGGTAAADDRTRKPDVAPSLAPAEISHAALLDALHRITGTGRSRDTLTVADAEAGRTFVDTLLAGRRPSGLRRAERAAVWAAAQGYRHPGAGA